ncbi:MAG: YaaR family protein [Spirochaetales bacterium]|nr:YaaR family protein [Spirochaetales bacterium]
MEKINFLTQTLLAASTNKKQTKSKKTDKPQFKNLFSANTLNTQTQNEIEIEKASEEEIETLLSHIKDAGDILSAYPSMKNITSYKQQIKDFFNFIVNNSFDIETKRGSFNIMKQSRKEYTVINIINEKLSKLAEEIRHGEQSNIKILASVNEINGLIVDLLR